MPEIAAVEQAEIEQIRALKERDREVRQHDRAHAAAAAGVQHGAPSYTFARGADGQLYAVGGEVQIDIAPVAGDPRATLEKAQTIQRAALAPVEPSGPDRAVAAQAAAMAATARVELQQLNAHPSAAAAVPTAETNGDSRSLGAQSTSAPSDPACAVCGAPPSASEHLAETYAELGDRFLQRPRAPATVAIDIRA